MTEKLSPDTAEPLEGLDRDTDLNLQRRLVNDLNANTAGPTGLMTVPPNGNSETPLFPPMIGLERYVFERQLGQGGMGVVYLAHDKQLPRKVAIKQIRTDLSYGPESHHRFLAEARAVAALSHEGIIHIYEMGESEAGPYFVMEYVAGETLEDRLKRDRVLPLDEAIRMTMRLCNALSCAHSGGVIHRDIKPANILLDQNGRPKLIDFGIAKHNVASKGLTRSNHTLGTEVYMAPEQRRDASKVDARSDQWSLAATTYQMLTGHLPIIIRPDRVDASVRSVLEQALEDDPALRFAQITDFSRALDAARRQSQGFASSVPSATTAAARYLEAQRELRRLEQDARDAVERSEYALAVELLEKIPEDTRDGGLYEMAQTRAARTASLERELEERLNSKQLDGLSTLVSELLEYFPQRTDLSHLLEELRQVDARKAQLAIKLQQEHLELTKKATFEIQRGNYQQSIALLEQVPVAVRDHGLYDLAKSRQQALDEFLELDYLFPDGYYPSWQAAYQRGDYAEAVVELERLPSKFRDEKLYRAAIERAKRVQVLESEIESRLGNKQFDRVEILLFELSCLQPNRELPDKWKALPKESNQPKRAIRAAEGQSAAIKSQAELHQNGGTLGANNRNRVAVSAKVSARKKRGPFGLKSDEEAFRVFIVLTLLPLSFTWFGYRRIVWFWTMVVGGSSFTTSWVSEALVALCIGGHCSVCSCFCWGKK